MKIKAALQLLTYILVCDFSRRYHGKVPYPYL